jgi:hypothetical protein
VAFLGFDQPNEGAIMDYNKLREPPPVPVGTRIALISMPADPDPVAPGTTGTVVGGSAAQMWVDWDDGRSLMLIPGTDRYRVIEGGR